MDQWLIENLVCPRHHVKLTLDGNRLSARCGCQYPVIDGIPVLLLNETPQTIGIANTTLKRSQESNSKDSLFLDTLGISELEKQGILDLLQRPVSDIDPVVSFMVGATNGIAYESSIGRLKEYPIPTLRLPDAGGEIFLDIGCNWGRWSIAAAKKGYRVIGIDPSLGAVMAARRVCKKLGLDAAFFIVGDARYLPIKSNSVDQVFSYSVLQHFSREDAALAIQQVGRVLIDNGKSLIQMPTKFGLRCLYHQARRRFREAQNFEVRYWTIPSLRRLFSTVVGDTKISVDCFFGIGLQYADLRLMPLHLKVIVLSSEILRALSRILPPLKYLADSVYVSSKKSSTLLPKIRN